MQQVSSQQAAAEAQATRQSEEQASAQAEAEALLTLTLTLTPTLALALTLTLTPTRQLAGLRLAEHRHLQEALAPLHRLLLRRGLLDGPIPLDALLPAATDAA